VTAAPSPSQPTHPLPLPPRWNCPGPPRASLAFSAAQEGNEPRLYPCLRGHVLRPLFVLETGSYEGGGGGFAVRSSSDKCDLMN